MAQRKAGGTAKNLRDSNPKYLGVKRSDGQKVTQGEVIVRQRGTKVIAGKNIGVGKTTRSFLLPLVLLSSATSEKAISTAV